MSNDADLKIWVNDQLMSIVGGSTPTAVRYIIAIAKQASSPAAVAEKLVEYKLPKSFAEEIFTRVPRKASGLNSYQKHEREAAMLVKKQKTYALLDADDDDEDDVVVVGGGDQVSVPKKVDAPQKRFRKKTENQDDDDDDDDNEAIEKEKERRVRRRISPDEDDSEAEEEARIRDQEERKQLERNLRERDAAGTRKLTEHKLTRKEEEEIIRRSKALEQNETMSLRDQI